MRVQGGLLGQKTGAGWYAYADGKRQEPPLAPAPQALPRSMWIMQGNENPEYAIELTATFAAAGIAVDRSEYPTAEALIVLTPVGVDLTTACCELGFDPAFRLP